MASFRYSLGPLDWVTADGASYWQSPVGSVGFVDLRGLPACGEAGTSANRQVAFCWWPASGVKIPASHAVLNASAGDLREINATAGMRSAFGSKTGYTPSATLSKLVDLLADIFTNGSVPDATGTVPTLESDTIYLPDHSPVWTAPKDWRSLNGFRNWNTKYDDRQQRKVMQWIAEEESGLLPPGIAMKALGALLIKHGAAGSGRGKGRTWSESEWQRFVPANQRAKVRAMGGPKTPSTTISDNFNRADGAVGANWTGDTGNYSIVSNQLRVANGVSTSHLYHISPLSSSDMQTQVTHISNLSGVSLFAGPTTRHSSTATTYYLFNGADRYRQLLKRVSGTYTLLTGGYGVEGIDDGDIALFSVAGSSLVGRRNGTIVSEITDSAISGTLYAGMAKSNYTNAYGLYDNWSATDGLPDPPPAPTVTPLTTTSTTPTLTGTFTASETDELQLTVDSVTYGDDDFEKDGNNWSLTLTTPLEPGTYSVTLTAINDGGETDDETDNELTIEEPSGGEHINIPFPISTSISHIHHIHHYYPIR